MSEKKLLIKRYKFQSNESEIPKKKKTDDSFRCLITICDMIQYRFHNLIDTRIALCFYFPFLQSARESQKSINARTKAKTDRSDWSNQPNGRFQFLIDKEEEENDGM